MNLAAIGTGIFGFLKRIPDWVIWALGVIIFLKFVDMNAERRGREKQKQAGREDALKVDNTILENSDAQASQADRIRAANPVEPEPVDGIVRQPSLPSYHFRD
jgi:hypothetical protein